MKTKIALLLAAVLFVPATYCHGQGALTPPGAPAPTQKSLQEIWDRIGTLETQHTIQQTQVTALREQNDLLTSLLGSAGVNFAWQLTTVDATGDVG